MTEKEIWDKAYKRIFELYGDMPDLRIVSRFYSEKQGFMQYEVGKYFFDLVKLRGEINVYWTCVTAHAHAVRE